MAFSCLAITQLEHLAITDAVNGRSARSWRYDRGSGHLGEFRSSTPACAPPRQGSVQRRQTPCRRAIPGRLNRDDECTFAGSSPQNRRLLASRQLSVGRPDLSSRQSASQTSAVAGTRQAQIIGALGHHAGAELHLRSPQPDHPAIRSEHHQYHRPRSWRAGPGCQLVSGGDLQRGVSGCLAG